MEKKQRPRLAERIAENFREADRKESRPAVLDLMAFVRKKPGKLS